MKYLILFSLLFSAFVGIAQEKIEETKNEISDTLYQQSKSYITFEIISLFNNVTPRYRFGYIRRLNDRWAIGGDLAYGSQKINFVKDEGQFKDYSLFEARAELYYTLNLGKKVQQYLSTELFYLNHNATFLNSGYETEETGQTIVFTSADYNRKKYGIQLKYGLFINFTKNFGINPYVGIGIRNRENTYSNVTNPENGDGDFLGLLTIIKSLDFRRKEGLKQGPIVDLGFKLFYRLN